MILVIILDIIVVAVLFGVARRHGIEQTLPVATCLLLLFPFESQLSLPGLFDLTTQRIVILSLAVIYLMWGSAHDTVSRQSKLPLKYLLIFLLCWMTLSTVNSVVVSVSLKTVLSECFDFFLLYYICAKSLTSIGAVNRVLGAVVTAMAINSIFGILEVYQGWSVLSLFPTASHRFAGLVGVVDRDARVQATFGHAILFGAALAMAVPIALYLLSMAETRKQRVLLWVAIILMFVNLYKTMSRGPWMAAVFAVVAVLTFGGTRMRRYVAVIAVLTVVTLVVRPGVFSSIQNLYGETLDPETAQGGSYQWRYALYDIAFRHLNNDLGRALWGYGPESFYYLGWKGEFQGAVVPFESCDSSVAALMIETGYVGLLIVALLLIRAALTAYRQYRRMEGPGQLLCLVLLVDIVSFGFLMTNVAIFGWGQQSYLIWILLAIAMTHPRLAEEASAAVPALTGEADHCSDHLFPEQAYLQERTFGAAKASFFA